MTEKTHFDLIILGAGPAGMAAGIYAARKQMDMLIISENVGGQALWSSGIENYPGYIFITGVELTQKFEEHMRTFNIRLEFAKTSRLTRSYDLFEVELEDGRQFYARAVVVATGKSPRLLDVPGEHEFTGRGVTYCATCDAPLFAGSDVVVAGGGNSGLDAVMQLMKICPRVYLLECGSELTGDEVVARQVREARNVEVRTHTGVREIVGDTFVTAVVVENLDTHRVETLQVRGVFVEVGLRPNSGIVKDLVRLNSKGEIPVDCAARTGVPGLYAAGDVTDVPEKQIVVAAGDGAKAALGAYSYLIRLPSFVDWGAKT